MSRRRLPTYSDITVGKAKIHFNPLKKAWVAPGGKLIYSERRAVHICTKMDEEIRGGFRL